PADVELEAIRELGILDAAPGERRNLHRIAGHERRRHELFLGELLEELEHHLAAAPARVERQAPAFREGANRRIRGEVRVAGSRVAADRVVQGHALPRWREVDVVFVPTQLEAADDPPSDLTEQL